MSRPRLRRRNRGARPGAPGDLAAVGLKALVAATLATLITGAVAGVFYHGQAGILGLAR